MKKKITFGKFSSEVEIDYDGSLIIELNGDDCWLEAVSDSYDNQFIIFFTWNGNKDYFRFVLNEIHLGLTLSPWFSLDYLKQTWVRLKFNEFEFFKFFTPRRGYE